MNLKEYNNIMALCSEMDKVVRESGKVTCPEDIMFQMRSIRTLLPTILHKLAVMNHLIDESLQMIIKDNEQWKSIKHSSTIAIAFAQSYDTQVSHCKNRLEGCKKGVEITSMQLTTELSYYKTELNNLNH
jgi:hypothetical protein